ncbi:aminotransferase class V-fold PLP-dependent enzyme [Oxalobacteraceae bacterium]|nr:aminotransferase class V-fold PLP-dependent enzyme [Oxalobacteraceae bacterium]
MTTEIYLDGNATSSILPAALAAALDVLEQRFGNPSSTHATGLRARATLDAVRQRARRLLGVGDGKLMFNSGATEGIQTAVLSALLALRERRERGEAIGALLLYGATEHKAVPESLAHWNRVLGLHLELRALPVDGSGRHDLSALRVLAPQAGLVCTMAANNETGVISDLAGIEAVLADCAAGALWLVDCVQALGKLDLHLASTRIDYAPFSGHKLYAPKGVGMLYVRAGAPYTALMMGGGQEDGLRSGTENMAGIAALGAVLAALEDGATFRSHAELAGFRKRLADSLRGALPGVVFNNDFACSLPTTLNFSVPGVPSATLMDVFDAAGVRVSSGSACSAKKAAPSYVLEAMQLPRWRSAGAIRMSFGALVDEATIAAACARIARCGEALRASCLIPSQQAPLPHDGVVQLGVEGACSWLVLDAASRSCVIIDPLPEACERIEQFVRCQQYAVRAVLSTVAEGARARLVAALGAYSAGIGPTDALGWPRQAGEGVMLDDGGRRACLTLGQQTVARLEQGTGQAAYLLGRAVEGRLPAQQLRFAFVSQLAAADGTGQAAAAALAGVIEADTLLCPTRASDTQFCSSPRALAQPRDPVGEELQVHAAALDTFLRSHPGTVLIDVREPYEYAAAGAPAAGDPAAGDSANASGPGGHPARSVPLSRLSAHLSEWLHGTPVPLLFFCRSGNRSVKAAQCLRRLGYSQAWHLSGGLALAPLARAA